MRLTVKSVASACVAHLVDGQRHAVERHRALGGEEAAKLRRDPDPEAGRAAFGREADDFADAVDMAGDEMAAELVAEAQRALEVEPGARSPMVGGGARRGSPD